MHWTDRLENSGSLSDVHALVKLLAAFEAPAVFTTGSIPDPSSSISGGAFLIRKSNGGNPNWLDGQGLLRQTT